MKLFSTVLMLESHYQSGPKAFTNETFLNNAKISFPAKDEADARRLIQENFSHRIPAFCYQKYELKCEGEAPPEAKGFVITPIPDSIPA